MHGPGFELDLGHPETHHANDKGKVSPQAVRRGGTFRNHSALLSIECRNLKGPSLGTVISSKCAISGGEYDHYMGKRKKFRWELVGETEFVRHNNSPSFQTTVEIAYDMTKSRLLRFDLLGSLSEDFADGRKWKKTGETKPAQGHELRNAELAAALRSKTEFTQQEWEAFGISDLRNDDFIKMDNMYFKPEPETFHIGAYVCDVHDLLKAESWELNGTLIKKGKGSVDNSHLHFEVTRNIRETLTPQDVMKVFKTVDTDKSMSLNKLEFKNAMRIMARQGHYSIRKEGEDIAWEIADADTNGSVNYAEFVAIIFGTQGSISVMIEDRGEKSAVKHADMLFNKYRKELGKRLGRKDQLPVEDVVFDPANFEKEALLDTQDRAMRLVAGVSNAQFNGLNFDLPKRKVADDAGVLQVARRRVFVESGSSGLSGAQVEWGKRCKARGMIITKGDRVSVATCNLLTPDAGPCSVMSSQSIPATGVTYFEISCMREVHPGGSLDGPYAVGLATSAFDKFDGSWTKPHVHAACFGLVNIKPTEYDASWSLRHRASSILVQGMANQVASLGTEKLLAASAGSQTSADEVSNIMGKFPLPRGNCYFEITIKAVGKSKDESLGGKCHVGLCSEAMSGLGWEGEWTKHDDPRRLEAWTLCDHWNGQLSTSVFGLDSSERMSERQMMQRMHEKFNHFDRDNSGTIDWDELQVALKDMAICCTDDGTRFPWDVFVHDVACMSFCCTRARSEFVSVLRSLAEVEDMFTSLGT